MTRIALVVVLLGSLVGCNKPSEESCQKAIENMQKLLGTENLTTDVQGEVRRCVGGSKKEAVDCAGKATTIEQLRACDFMKTPKKAPATTDGSGSADGSAK